MSESLPAIGFFLVVGHALADYPLQGDFLARGKNRHTPLPGLPGAWPWCLSAHALIHGGAVAIVTGSLALGIAETIVHWLIDFGKCEGWFGFHADQFMHVACKALWLALIVAGLS